MLKLKLKLKIRFQSKEIPGYSNYDLHIYGDNDYRVWSKPREASDGHKYGGCYMTNYLNPKGYLMVCLTKDRESKAFGIHRIVAWIFVENTDSKPTVDHIDRNPENNRPGNLRWATRQEQIDNRGMYSNNKSGVSGVSWNEGHNKWRVDLTENGVNKYFGVFEDFKDAEAKRHLEYTRIHNGELKAS